jgi:hypothetical protein
VNDDLIVATKVGKNYDPNQPKWQYKGNELVVNDIKVIYSTDLFSSVQVIGEEVKDVVVATNKLVLLRYIKGEFDLSYGVYNEYGFYLERIEMNVEIPNNQITLLVLVSENLNYNLFYIGYTNNKLEIGDIFISNTHDNVWNLTLSGVPLTREKTDFSIDFHKVNLNLISV